MMVYGFDFRLHLVLKEYGLRGSSVPKYGLRRAYDL